MSNGIGRSAPVACAIGIVVAMGWLGWQASRVRAVGERTDQVEDKAVVIRGFLEQRRQRMLTERAREDEALLADVSGDDADDEEKDGQER